MPLLPVTHRRLIAHQRSRSGEPQPDIATARQRLRRAARNIDEQFSPVNLLRAQLNQHPYVTVVAAVGAGAATGVLSRPLGTVMARTLASGLLPLASRMAVSWLIRPCCTKANE